MAYMIVGALVPVFGLILIGFACGRFNVLGERAFEVLNRFVIVITLPVLTFRSIAKMEAADLAVMPMIGAVLGGAFFAYALGYSIERWFGRPAKDANIAGLSSSFSNVGFVGLPIALIAFGQDALGPVAVTMFLYSAVVFTVALLVGEVAANPDDGLVHGLRASGHAIVRSPLIMLALAGVAWAAFRLPLEGPLDVLLQTLASATAPCALTAIGLFISLPRSHAAPGPIGRVVSIKLAVQPAATALLVWLLPPMPPLWGAIAVLTAAMPCGATSFVLAGKAGRWAMELSAWSVTLTTTFATLTLIPVLWWIGMPRALY